MAYSAADALASAMYDSMFDWLIGRVNFAVQVKIKHIPGSLLQRKCEALWRTGVLMCMFGLRCWCTDVLLCCSAAVLRCPADVHALMY